MTLGRPYLGAILTNAGVITHDQLDAALRYKSEHNCRLGDAVVNAGFCTDADVARALAEQLELPYVDLRVTPPMPDALSLVPREAALEYAVLPVRIEHGRLLVVARDPFDIRVDEIVRQLTGGPIVLGIAPESQLQEMLNQYYSLGHVEDWKAQDEDVDEDMDGPQEMGLEKLVTGGDEVNAVRVVNTLLVDAIRRGASDLHVEPGESCVRVRYRVDGLMSPVVTLPRSLMPSVAARVKIMSGMDISEARRPQDGGCRVQVQGQNVEIRASTLPGVYGEIVVMRVLAQDSNLHSIDSLNLHPRMDRQIRQLLAARQGMLLITGPTGSGKTTTLYGALNHLNRDDVNIITVEDPVERKTPGINQVEVNERAGRTFAATLRSMLRQDPDIIMLGEIRDLETADIACRAALTGHMVLSTLHTLDSVSTVTRLSDMGVEPFLLAASLNGVVAQRLVRRVCEQCAESYEPSAALLKAFQKQYGSIEGANWRRGRGCHDCQQRGVRGRVGIFEILQIDEEMRQLMVDGAPVAAIRARAEATGFQSLEQDAFHKALQGIIPPEGVLDLGLSLAMSMEGTGEPEAEPVREPARDLVLPELQAVTASNGAAH